jgi:hypothetical protein
MTPQTIEILTTIAGALAMAAYVTFLAYSWGRTLKRWGMFSDAPPKPGLLVLPPIPTPAVAHASQQNYAFAQSVGQAPETEDERLAAERARYIENEEARLEWEAHLKSLRNSAGYKRAFPYGKAAYQHGHSHHEGPHFKANSNERLGWKEGWEFAADEAVRAGQRNLRVLVAGPAKREIP